MTKELVEKAFKELYPEKQFNYHAVLRYSGKFRGFNGNIRFGFGKIEIRMSREFKKVSDEIKIGMIQSLLVKILQPKTMQKIMTTNMDLYEKFLKNVHIALPKEVESAELLEMFNNLNEQYFDGLLEQPSLRWGSYSKAKLGSYDYGRDTIVMSRFLEHAPPAYVAFVLYHEMLHKKHKYMHTNKRSLYHSRAFKADEAKFPNAGEIDKEIPKWLRWKHMPLGSKKTTTLHSWLDRFL